jgi:medium-chain acyl-[acyl-carrier-protein] hydrolase
MGALVAFELARKLRRPGHRQPTCLVVAAHRAPHLDPGLPPMSARSDAELLAHVELTYGRLPRELLVDPELCARVASMLRADFQLLVDYAHREEPPLSCPIVASVARRTPPSPPTSCAAGPLTRTASPWRCSKAVTSS